MASRVLHVSGWVRAQSGIYTCIYICIYISRNLKGKPNSF